MKISRIEVWDIYVMKHKVEIQKKIQGILRQVNSFALDTRDLVYASEKVILEKIRQFRLLGGGVCSSKAKPTSNGAKNEIPGLKIEQQNGIVKKEEIKNIKKDPDQGSSTHQAGNQVYHPHHQNMAMMRQSQVFNEYANPHDQSMEKEKLLGEYTYQMTEDQLNKIRSIMSKLRFESSREELSNSFVLKLFRDIHDTFSAVYSRGLTNPQTQAAFRQMLESTVNFLLALLYKADTQKKDLFDPATLTRLNDKLDKMLKLKKKFCTRLPVQISIFLISLMKKIISLKRKALHLLTGNQNPHDQYLRFDGDKWKDNYIKFCFVELNEIDQEKLNQLTQSLQIYYEFNRKQKFVVDILRSTVSVLQRHSKLQSQTMGFPEFFKSLISDNEHISFGASFFGRMMLFDELIKTVEYFQDPQNALNPNSKKADVAEHILKIVSSVEFKNVCDDIFFFKNLTSEPTRKRMSVQLRENMAMRFIDMRILIQTIKLGKSFKVDNSKFSAEEQKNIEDLDIILFERFLLESSIEVDCLLYHDEDMLKLIETIHSSLNDQFFKQLNEQIKVHKQHIEEFLVNNLHLEQQPDPKHRDENLFEQILRRKVNYSVVLRDPYTALSNRFIEAFINRIASKNDESQHEKGQEIHVNQRLKFISSNDLSKTDININGFVEDPLLFLEKYFLALSNINVNVVALGGAAGMGKTHLCRLFMRQLLKRIQETGSRKFAIPIMVDMIEVENQEKHSDLERFLKSSLERYPFRNAEEIAYLKNSTVPKVIILDGLSEWAWGSPNRSIREWIRLREWQNTKLVITSRRPFVRAEEYPYFYGQKCKQPADLQVGDDDQREGCFEVLQILSFSQEGVEDYVSQKEKQIAQDLGVALPGQSLEESMSMSELGSQSGIEARSKKASYSLANQFEIGVLMGMFRSCTRANSHLIDMLERPFNIFCFMELLSKVEGMKEIYWGKDKLANKYHAERAKTSTWLSNLEEMQEKLFIEEIQNMITDAIIEESLRELVMNALVQFFQSLAMKFFIQRKYKATLGELEDLIEKQKLEILNSGGLVQEVTSFEKVASLILRDIQQTSFLASSDVSFFTFIKPTNKNPSEPEVTIGQGAVPAVSQLFSFRNPSWLEFMIARAMKHDFDIHGNKLHTLPLSTLQKFAINRRYLLEERRSGEHLPFSLSQWTHHASVEMNILQKLAVIIRKDLLDDDFQQKMNVKDIGNQHRFIQLIQRTRRRAKKYYQSQQQQQQTEEWVLKQQRHPLDAASSNMLSAICFNKLTLANVKLRDCSFSRAYLYGYRGEIDVACSDVSESNLRASSIVISRSKFMHCLLDEEKKNHERWNSQHAYSYASLIFKDNKTLICGTNFGGISTFQLHESTMKKRVTQHRKDNQDDDQETMIQKSEDALSFWEMKSHQRHFQEEIRAVACNQGDIYYSFLNVIAHVNEQGQEKEVVMGHQNKINAIDICLKYNLLATASSDHTCRIWNIKQGGQEINKKKQTQNNNNNNESDSQVDEDVEESFAEMELLHTLNKHAAEITCAAFSPNGAYLATGSYDETIIIWDVTSQFVDLKVLTVNHDWITTLCFSGDSSILSAGSSSSQVRLWDIQNNFSMIQNIDRQISRVSTSVSEQESDCVGGIACLKFQPNGTLLAFATFEEPGVQVWDLAKKGKQKEYVQVKVYFLDSSVIISDFQTEKMPYFLVNSLAFSPDGKLLAAVSQNQSLCSVWNVQNSQDSLSLQSVLSPNKVAVLAVSTDQLLMATSGGIAAPHNDSSRITIWGMMKKGEQAMIIQTLDLQLHKAPITSLTFSVGDELIISADQSGHIVVWKGEKLYQQIQQPAAVNSADQSVNPINPFHYSPLKRFLAHKSSINQVAFSVNTQFLVTSSSREKSCKVWNVGASAGYTFEFSHSIQWEEELALSKLEFSPNGLYLATLPLPTINISLISTTYDALPPQPANGLASNSLAKKSSCCFIWDARDRFSYVGIVGTVKGQEGRSFSTQILAIGFSKNSQLFVTGQSNGLCAIWDSQTAHFSFIQTLDAHFSAISHLTFSGDSQMIATASIDQTCKLWHVPNRYNEVSSFYIPPDVSDIHFVRKGHSLAVASTSDEFCLKFYDVFSPSYQVDELRAHSSYVTQVVFSLDGRFLLTASRDSTCRIWDLKNNFFQHFTINLNFSKTQAAKNQPDSNNDQQGQDNHVLPKMKHTPKFIINEKDGEVNTDSETEDTSDGNNHKKKHGKTKGLGDKFDRKQAKKRHSFSAPPNIKPSQKYQQQVKEKFKDENIDEEDFVDIGGIITAVISTQGTFVFIVSGEDSKHIALYDLKRGTDDVRESILPFTLPDTISCLALSPKDDYLAVGCANGDTQIFKRTSLSPYDCELELCKDLRGKHAKNVSCAAFSRDLKYFATGSWDITCRVYEVANGEFQMLHNLEGQYGYILSIDFSLSGEQLAISSRDSSCYIWDLSNRLTIEEIMDHRQATTSISYSKYNLATASKDGSFILYDPRDDYKMVRKIERLPDSVTNVSLSPDGKYLVVGLSNSVIQVWDLFNQYDLTVELTNDVNYMQIVEMEKALEQNDQTIVSMSESICNFVSEEEKNEGHIEGDAETASQKEQMLKQIPTMKKDIVDIIFKEKYPAYKDNTNLQYEIETTEENHIIITLPKYPICLLTL